MSKFTTEVRFICETANGLTESRGFTSIQDILNVAAPSVFDFDFPIFDETYRLPLEVKILRHYYTREICEETVGLWKLRLADRLNMIMPYYNKLYESELLKFNPFYDVDLTTVHKKDFTGNEDTVAESKKKEIGVDNRDKRSSANGEKSEDVELTNISFDESESKDTIDKTENKNSDTTTIATNSKVTNESNEEKEQHDDVNVGTAENKSSKTNEGNSNQEGDSIGNDNKWDLYSDTPQGGINGIENAIAGISGNGYLTNARNNKGEDFRKTHEISNNNSIENETKNEENFYKNNGNKNTNSSSNSEIKDEGFGSSKTNDQIIGGESKTGINEKNAFSKSDKGTTFRTEDSTTENVEGFNVLTKDGNDTKAVDVNNTEEYIEHIVGKQGIRSYSKMLEEFRATFLNIDKMIIDELSDLFFGLWE